MFVTRKRAQKMVDAGLARWIDPETIEIGKSSPLRRFVPGSRAQNPVVSAGGEILVRFPRRPR
jgi:hypothetical protein